MNALLVYAHPEPRSFNAAMRDVAVETLVSAGHAVELSDLYATRFDAAGGPDDFMVREDGERFSYQREQRRAAAARTFVAPLQREMDVLPPFIAFGAARVSDAERAAYLEAFRARLATVETTAPLRFDTFRQRSCD